MNDYQKLKAKHQAEVNAFPMAFAFSQAQFEEDMKDLGLNPSDADKIYAISGTGRFYRRTDAKALHEMFRRHRQELEEAIQSDATGDGFIFQMFNCELADHEYGYSGDLDETLDALGYTMEDINADPRLVHGLNKAIVKQEDRFDELDECPNDGTL